MKNFLIFLATLGAAAFIAYKFLSLQPITGNYTWMDRAVHQVKVKGELELDFATLRWDMKESELTAAYPSVTWNCHAEPSTMGDRSCTAYVRRLNGHGAWHVAAFFRHGVLDQFLAKMPPEGYREQLEDARARYSDSFAPDLRGGARGDLLTWE